MIQFKKIPPHPHLQRYISTYWHMSSSAVACPPCFNRVFPDSFTDVIFNLGDSFTRSSGSDELRGNAGGAFIAGIMRDPIVVGLKGKVELIGISFKPGFAGKFLAVPVHELADQRIDLADIWKTDADEIEDILINMNDIRERIDYIDEYFLKCLTWTDEIDRRVEGSVDLIYRSGGRVAIDALEDLTGLSARQLERKFQSDVGVGPKALSGIIRFKNALSVIKDKKVSLIDIAYEKGYSDQAHFSREIKKFTGLSPSEIFKNKYSDVVFFQD